MKQWKRRTVALVLASVVTVVGAFGAENYKNSLMSLKFDSGENGAVNVTLFTKTNYENTIALKKQDNTTYVIMLPETEGRNADTNVNNPNIESVNVKTMLYTNSGKGYTKIIIKTSANTVLNAHKALYIPEKVTSVESKKSETKISEPKNENNTNTNEKNKVEKAKPNVYIDDDSTPQSYAEPAQIVEEEPQPESIKAQQPEPKTQGEGDNSEVVLMILGILLVMVSVIFIYIKGKNKMAEVLGEQTEFSFDDEQEKNEQQTKKQQIRRTIQKLDKMYSKPIKMPIKMETEPVDLPQKPILSEEEEEKSESTIVDLDELFKETTLAESEEETNKALDDFLSSFSFDSAEAEEEPKHLAPAEEFKIDEDLFNRYIVNGNIIFSKEDVERINSLLNLEINNETLKNVSQYLVSSAIKDKKPSRKELLENFVLDLGIKRNIVFTEADIDAVNKLMNVELDKDFVNNLVTNPQRVEIVQNDIKNRKVAHKAHDIILLNVKGMLPDLSEALKKQNGRRIESEVKPQVVYYSEGYDVSTLTVDKEDLPDLTIDLDNPEYRKYRPSDEVGYAESGYDYQTLTTNNVLPDLKDVLANPNKYEEKKEPVNVDEDALLKSISNVTFKPFYDGDENFEILNKFDDGKFETNNEQNSDLGTESIEDNFYDLDELSTQDKISKKETDAQELIRIIEEQQNERKKKIEKLNEIKASKKSQRQSEKDLTKKSLGSFEYKGKQYKELDISQISENTKCCLTQCSDEYVVFGCIAGRLYKLKKYEKLNTQRMQIRINEKISDEITQYIVRLGQHKFIINVSGDNMEYVMDLC